jgi:hypothetical protein
MKKIFFLIITFLSLLGYSQEVKLKKGDVIVDDVVWMKYQDCGTFDRTCSLLNLNNEELIFFKFINIEGALPPSSANSKGTLSYVEVKFLGYNKFFEIQKRQKSIIELLYNSKVVNTDGTLNQEKALILVEKYGTEFSDRLNKNQGNQTIIIQQPEPQRSGININLGR